ncbi:MAG: TonB-dependent receptor plug domain-containing protein, partial [Gammaproteobacteria bacterium]|nr:TonB-dependent receptor plug domain-containing protein [Gammaproteobacteria bacterium]
MTIGLALLAACGTPFADEPSAGDEEKQKEPRPVLETVQVIGSSTERFDLPGSAHLVTEEDIRNQSYDDINRILRKVPGVYLREEDGFGLFPNISLRGVDTTRSAKITLMEDGVLTAPAPYAAPSAYYSPTAGRMSGLEVLKGSSQVRFGPHVTGGVLNYQSTVIPESRQAYVKGLYGENNEYRLHAWFGDTVETAAGSFGYVLENYYRSSDGFKNIDAAPGYGGSDQTGFTNIEPMVKVAWEPSTQMYQRLEFKAGYTNREADATYLGLSDADIAVSPFRRYAASRFDNIDTEQYRGYLRYFAEPTDNLDVVATVYYNRFTRNWFKLNDLRGVGTAGNLSLSSALAGGGNGQGLACLTGAINCNLRVRNNNRSYESYGGELQATWRFETGTVGHEVATGVRYHTDEEDRFQRNEIFTQNAAGFITDRDYGTPGNAGDRVDSATGVAVFIQDSITFGRWKLVPGVRFETIDLERDNRASGMITDDDVNMVGGGLGLAYEFSDSVTLFGGVHRGFSPPSPGGAINDELQEETSVSVEGGFRYVSADGTLFVEAAGFYTQFEDLIVVDNIGGTGTGDPENFGEVDTLGLEFSANFDPARRAGKSYSTPLFMAFTYTDAEQQNDAVSSDPESIFSFGRAGNAVPYIPEIVLNVGAGVDFDRFGGEVVVNYTDETFTSASNVTLPVNGAGAPDARYGVTDDFLTVDISAYY